MSTVQREIFEAIAREREYQDWKHGSLEVNPHGLGEWLLILEAELNEAKRTWLGQTSSLAIIEVLQIAAVAVACLEQYGVDEREYPDYDGEF